MKGIVLIGCLACSYSIITFAQITSDTDYYSAVCIADASVGFKWENGNWKAVNYKPDKYIVQKLEVEDQKIDQTTRSFPCSYDQNWRSVPFGFGDLFVKSGCYNVRESGSEFHAHLSQTCSETWKKDSETKTERLESINCEHFKFRPNGWFHKSFIHNETENKPRNDYKDSLALSVGKCSTL